ncbi:MAG: hypothetical protein ACO3L1_00055 [Flavobacteriaceae bacterium]
MSGKALVMLVWKLCGTYNLKTLIVIFAVVGFGGCSAGRWTVEDSPAISSYKESLIQKYSDGHLPPYANESADGRNLFINEMLYLSNEAFDEYEESLYSSSSNFELVTDLLVLGLTSSSAFASGSVVKTVLAATAAATSGVRTTVDRAFFKEQSRLALLSKMREMRRRRLVIIRTSMELPLDSYSLTDAMLDLQEYDNAGNILAALQSITEEASIGINLAEDELLHLRGANFDTGGFN